MYSNYQTAHRWIFYNGVKTGICENCKEARKTEWSNKTGEYRCERDDWQELCHRCHLEYDRQPHMRGVSAKAGAPKSFIQVTVQNFAIAEEARTIITLYKIDKRQRTLMDALFGIVTEWLELSGNDKRPAYSFIRERIKTAGDCTLTSWTG